MKTPSLLRKGFTLIELIVVIAILATLASIAFPAYMAVQNSAQATAARKVCTDIVSGVTNFSQDNNGMLPYDAKAVEPDRDDQMFLETTAGKDAKLIAILTNREEDDDNRINSTRDTYLKADEQETPADGLFIDSSDGVNYYDPWGQPYYVVLCEEEKGCADPFNPKKHFRGKHCLVYCTGPDKAGVATPAATGKGKKKPANNADDEEEALEDNIYSWKKSK